MSKDKHLHCPAPTPTPASAPSGQASIDAATAVDSTMYGTVSSKKGATEGLIVNLLGESKDGVFSSNMGASKGAILIDDRESARDAWVAAGGQVT